MVQRFGLRVPSLRVSLGVGPCSPAGEGIVLVYRASYKGTLVLTKPILT